MATKNLVECPVLPAGPVDVDALNKALTAGKSADEAIAEATKNNPKPPEVKAEPAPVETNAAAAAPVTEKE